MNRMTKEERSARDRAIPKCRCGNNLSFSRQREGITVCPACDESAHSGFEWTEHAAEALRFRDMAKFGKQKALLCSKQGDYLKAQRWEQWAYYKELEAEFYESQI